MLPAEGGGGGPDAVVRLQQQVLRWDGCVLVQDQQAARRHGLKEPTDATVQQVGGNFGHLIQVFQSLVHLGHA